MKYGLQRGAEFLNVARFGRVVTVSHGDGRSEDHGYFDDRAAEEAKAVMIDQFLSEGWVESAEAIAVREAANEKRRKAEAALAANEAVVAAAVANPREALRDAAGEWFAKADAAEVEALLGFVTSIDSAGERGFEVQLSTGGKIDWTNSLDDSLVSLSLFTDEDEVERDEHSVIFGHDVGPPEHPDEVEYDVDWFLSTWPNERYWFTRPAAPSVAHVWLNDGGLREDGRSVEQVLVSVLLEELRKVG